MPYKKQTGAYAVIITAAIVLHLFAAGGVYLLVQRETRLAEYRNAYSLSTAKAADDSEKAAEAFAPARILYITIDDGPSPDSTPLILDVLLRHNAKALFFPLPVEGEADLYNRIISEGHSIGNHTFSHDYNLLYNSKNSSAFRDDIIKMNDFLMNFGIEPTLFRYPGGDEGRPDSIISPRRETVSALGLTEVSWDISLGDDSPRFASAETMANNVIEELRGRTTAILLLHDSTGHAESASALDMILTKIEAMGWVVGSL